MIIGSIRCGKAPQMRASIDLKPWLTRPQLTDTMARSLQRCGVSDGAACRAKAKRIIDRLHRGICALKRAGRAEVIGGACNCL